MKINVNSFLGAIALMIASCFASNAQERAVVNVNQANFEKYRFGGYGEILYQHMDYSADRYNDPQGAPKENRAFITLPRTVFTFDYKFRNDILFTTELEFEYGGTGSALELEYEEFGEYEMEVEKAGEVMLEQLMFTKLFNSYFNLRVGHMRNFFFYFYFIFCLPPPPNLTKINKT